MAVVNATLFLLHIILFDCVYVFPHLKKAFLFHQRAWVATGAKRPVSRINYSMLCWSDRNEKHQRECLESNYLPKTNDL